MTCRILTVAFVAGLAATLLFSSHTGDLYAEERPPTCKDWTAESPVHDWDGDGLLNTDEMTGYEIEGEGVPTDPCKKDSDGDGLTDKNEVRGGGPAGDTTKIKTNPMEPDTDRDGLSDYDEFQKYEISLDGGVGAKKIWSWSNPMMIDTDGDGLTDKEEREGGWTIQVNGITKVVMRTSAMHKDTDRDGLLDKEELDGLIFESMPWNGVKTDPTVTDTDEDGFTDKEEFYGIGPEEVKLDPTRKDTDGDGLDDKKEADSKGLCDPSNADMNGNGLADGLDQDSTEDSANGDSPNLDCGTIEIADTDQDGLPDLIEELLGLDPENQDSDNDGLDDKKEADSKGLCDPSNPDMNGNGLPDGLDQDPTEDSAIGDSQNLDCGRIEIADTDQDGLPDRMEELLGLNPDNRDSDNDGLDDKYEIQNSTHPNMSDTDGDGILDGEDDSPNSASAAKDLNKFDQTSGGEAQKSGAEKSASTTPEPSPLNSSQDSSGEQDSSGGLELFQIAGGAVVGLVAGVIMVWGMKFLTGSAQTGNRPGLRSDERQVEARLNRAEAEVQEKNAQLEEQRIRQTAGNATESDRLRVEAERLREGLTTARVALAGRIAATQRAIPDAMLDEARNLIDGGSDNDVPDWNLRLNRADSLIDAVSRFFLGR